LRILVVDNDPMVLDSMRAVLEADGHTVAVANGGQAGLETFKAALSGAAPFSVVITDLSMPGMDGYQLAHAVKDLSRATSVILLTGWGNKMPAGTGQPVDIALPKPLRLRELRAALIQCRTEAGTGSA
jgi:DNA-binding response OmpR family regulator